MTSNGFDEKVHRVIARVQLNAIIQYGLLLFERLSFVPCDFKKTFENQNLLIKMSAFSPKTFLGVPELYFQARVGEMK